MQEVEWDALRNRDPSVLDAAVSGEDEGAGGGDLRLATVAEQPREPVMSQADGGGLHDQ